MISESKQIITTVEKETEKNKNENIPKEDLPCGQNQIKKCKPVFKIDIEMVKLEREQNIQKKMEENKDKKLTIEEKRKIVLVNEAEKYYSIDKEEIDNSNNDTTQSISLSLDDNSLPESNSSKCLNIDIIERELNTARAAFYLKHNLYDVPITSKNSNDYFHPKKSLINDERYIFVYPNEFTTYYITQSGFLITKKNKILDENSNSNIKFSPTTGLYFCGKTVEIDSDVKSKKCAPNEFMCKECMEINKKQYNIKNKYFININGRVAKINKGKFHCFGSFLIGRQIEDCIAKFSCKACKLLDLCSKYYSNNFKAFEIKN